MSPEEFFQFANLIPEAMLLVAGDGVILAANRGAEKRLAVGPQELHGRPLAEFVADTPSTIGEYLRTCSRSREPVIGSLPLKRGDRQAIPCRCEGAVVRPRSGEAPATLLLRLVPKAEAPSNFAILTQRIDELTREIARRKHVEEELHAHREWLRVTLSSIADAVIATDEHGCITFINSVAQVLTGWPEREAVGRSLEQVFRIIHEQTRKPVEHPVAQVLRDGRIVGLAHHPVLIARDGTEYPIDERAAPIQADDRSVLGVVLIFREVAERRRMETELRERAEALAAAARRRDEFLAMLAHELRNPLGAMSNALHVMGLSGPNTPAYERARESARRQIRHQTRLVDDLLDVSRITRNRLELRRERLDLTRLVRETVDDFRGTLQAGSLPFTVALPEAPLPVLGDRTRLAQVLWNLLDNAAKFTPPGGEVTVRVTVGSESGLAQVTVRDTGAGIEPDLLPHVFDSFTQGDRSLDRSRGGLGLGLALVKGLVELHGGKVHAHSEGVGRGSEFTFLLAVESEPPVVLDEAIPRPQERGALRILVVEDNEDAAHTLRDLLEVFGYEVELAYSGPAGVEAARQFHPQVILCDIGLPGMDGYQVATMLRHDPSTASVHLIAITGYGGEEDRRRSQAAGFEALLTKPVDLQELEQLLASAGEQ